MAEKLIEINDDNFEKVTSDNKVVLVDFWAPWCGPCRMQTPILEEVADTVGDSAVIGKVNVDESPALAAKFGVRSIPTLIVFKDSQIDQQMVGVQQADVLVKALQ